MFPGINVLHGELVWGKPSSPLMRVLCRGASLVSQLGNYFFCSMAHAPLTATITMPSILSPVDLLPGWSWVLW